MKKFGKIIAPVLALCLTAGLAACGGGGGNGANGRTTVKFAYGADSVALSTFKKMVDEFNKSDVAAENKVFIKRVPKTRDEMQNFLSTNLASRNGPDLVTLEDEWYKTLLTNLEPLSDVATANVGQHYEGAAVRGVWDPVLNVAKGDRYAVPVYNDPTVLYVNTTALTKAGVKCISVEDTDEAIAAFNAGGADRNGNTKASLGISGTVLKKGFQRQYAYVEGRNWFEPAAGEEMIFNDCIPMSWDETEDLGRIMCSAVTNSGNPNVTTDYGFYTEWWFPYGWTVGGDCVIDVTGNGDYYFGLPENFKNYIVVDSNGYDGATTGRHYNKGETLEFADKIVVEEGQQVTQRDDGTFVIGETPVTLSAAVIAAKEQGKLDELPSTKEAFTRFAKLAASEYSSTRISPYPTEVSQEGSSIQYFIAGKMAMVIEKSHYMKDVKQLMQSTMNGAVEWTIAPMPIYKTYSNVATGEVDVQGKLTGHSYVTTLAIRKGSLVKDKAEVAINWMATEGQKYFAEAGLGTVNAQFETAVLNSNTFVPNTKAFAMMCAVSTQGDWAYLKNRNWISIWAEPLNTDVRNGNMSLASWFTSYVAATNAALAQY